jgi:hypothetical protein
MLKKLEKINPAFGLLCIGCLLGGLKNGWFVFPVGIMICMLLGSRLRQSGRIYISRKFNIVYLLLLCLAAVSVMTAVSRGDAVVGLLKLVIVGIYMVWCLQMTEIEKTEAIANIPKLGILVLVSSALLIFLPSYRDVVINRAGRLSGIFEYSNTLALIFLISLATFFELEDREHKATNREQLMYFATMVFGILWTGSRFTIVLTVIYLISLGIRHKRVNPVYILTAAIIVAFIILYSRFTGDVRGIARIGTLFSNSSTLIGRVIYWKDGLQTLLANPFGMGSMGWFLTQEATQSAPYVTKFVHNSFLQIGLDYGIVFMVITIGLALLSIIHARKGFKTLLVIIYMHMFFEFDSEYMVVLFIVILFVESDWLGVKDIPFEPKRLYINGALTVIVLLFIWQSAFWLSVKANRLESALKMNPESILIETEVMTREDDLDAKYRRAKHILTQNQFIGQAYDECAMYDSSKGQIVKLLKDGRRACKCQKYYMEAYGHYIILLENAYLSGDAETQKLAVRGMETVVKDLKKVEEDTDKLAYKTVDAPNFVLPYESVAILNKHKITYD